MEQTRAENRFSFMDDFSRRVLVRCSASCAKFLDLRASLPQLAKSLVDFALELERLRGGQTVDFSHHLWRERDEMILEMAPKMVSRFPRPGIRGGSSIQVLAKLVVDFANEVVKQCD